MRSTILLLAVLAVSTVRAETVVVSTPAVGGTTFYDYRTPGNPNNFHFGAGGRTYTNIRSDIAFAAPVAPAGGRLDSSILTLHVALSQLVFGGPFLDVSGHTEYGLNLLDTFSPDYSWGIEQRGLRLRLTCYLTARYPRTKRPS